MNMKLKAAVVAAILLVMAAHPAIASDAGSENSTRAVKVGLVTDAASAADEHLAAAFEAALNDLLSPAVVVDIPADCRLAGDGTYAGAVDALSAAEMSPQVDVVVAAGYLVSLAAARRGAVNVPTIAPLVLDARLHGLACGEGGGGIAGLGCLSADRALEAAVRSFLEIVPFRRLALVGPEEMFADPASRGRLDRLAAATGVEVVAAPVAKSAATALDLAATAPADCDAVMLAPFAADAEQTAVVAGIWVARGLPAFVMGGRADVAKGFLAGLPGEDILRRLARRTALHIQRILRGEAAETLPTLFAAEDPPVLNMAVARALGLDLDRSLLTLLDRIEDPSTGRDALTLAETLAEAVRANRDLRAEAQAVAAGEAAVSVARSTLLPHAEIGATGSVIDSDRAELSFGSIAERRVLATASVTQVLFSDAADAGYDIEKNRQTAREQGFDRARLDVTLAAGTAWLSVCRTRLLEDIRRRELGRTRRNLELARSRRDLGEAGPAEVMRWEADLASRRNDLEQASSRRRLAAMELNRILDRPLDAPVNPADPADLLAADPFREHLAGTAGLDRTERWLVDIARRNSPELMSLQAAAAGQRRALSAANRSFYLPTVALKGEYARRMVRDGEGSTASEIVAPVPITCLRCLLLLSSS